MKYIAHRGNIDGIKKHLENSPEYIQAALDAGFDCEIDVWFKDGTWFLGHDESQYTISLDFLYKPGLWIHCKNIDALTSLSYLNNLNIFWHQEDDYTLTSKNYVWCYPGKMVSEPTKTICVKPEVHDTDWKQFGGVCSDYVRFYRD